MNTNKTGMGGQDQRGGTGVLDEEKKKGQEEMRHQGGKEHGKYGQQKPEHGKQDFRYDKGGNKETGNEHNK